MKKNHLNLTSFPSSVLRKYSSILCKRILKIMKTYLFPSSVLKKNKAIQNLPPFPFLMLLDLEFDINHFCKML